MKVRDPRGRRRLPFPDAAVASIVVLGLLACLGVHAWIAPHFVRFSVDSVFYLSVARNLAAGKGLCSSIVLGMPTSLPAPFTIQPPGYPLAVGALIGLGWEAERAATLVPLLAHLLTFGLFCALGAARGGRRGCALAAILYATFGPLVLVSAYAWSESLFVLLIVAALLLAQGICRRPRVEPSPLRFAALGGAVGLAFATRYVGAVSLVLVLAAVWRVLPALRGIATRRRGAVAVALACILSGALFGPILWRNHRLTGTLSGGERPASGTPFAQNVAEAARTATLDMFPGFPVPGLASSRRSAQPFGGLATVGALVLLLGVLAGWRAARGREPSGLLPLLWAGAYLAVLCVLRSRSHFDPLATRLMAPFEAVLLYALVDQGARILGERSSPRWALPAILVGVAWFACGQVDSLAAQARTPRSGVWPGAQEAAWLRERSNEGDAVVTNIPRWLARRLPSLCLVGTPVVGYSSEEELFREGSLRRLHTEFAARYLVLFKPAGCFADDLLPHLQEKEAFFDAQRRGYVALDWDASQRRVIMVPRMFGAYMDRLFAERGSSEARLVKEFDDSLIFQITAK